MDTFAVLRQFLPVLQTVTIEPRLGQTGSGAPAFGPPVAVEAVVDQTRRRVRDAQGAEVVSQTTFACATGTSCPDGSRITLPDGQITYSITVSAGRDHGQGALPGHVEIACK